MAVSRAKRATQLGVLAGGEAARRAAVKTTNRVRSQKAARVATDARHAEFVDRLVSLLGSMGGCTMKFGQLFSMMDGGLIPEDRRAEFQTKLAVLQNRGADMPWHKVRRQVEVELGCKLHDAFCDFDQSPVASASIGQVHRAKLRTGRDVAVKVQYPGIDNAVTADIKNLRLILGMYRMIHPALKAGAVAAELESRMIEELDYRIEAANTRQLAKLYRGHPFIRIPDVVDELSGHRVIVTDWIAGRQLMEFFDAPLEERNRLAEIIFRFYTGGAHKQGVFSADPHPGNCLIMDDGAVAFVDFGSVKSLAPHTRNLELQALRAVAEGDAGVLISVGRALGCVSGENVSADALMDTYRRILGWYLRDEPVEYTPGAASENLAALLIPRNQHVREFNMPAELFLRARADLQVAGVMGQLRPIINLYSVAREWLYGDAAVTDLGRLECSWASLPQPNR